MALVDTVEDSLEAHEVTVCETDSNVAIMDVATDLADITTMVMTTMVMVTTQDNGRTKVVTTTPIIEVPRHDIRDAILDTDTTGMTVTIAQVAPGAQLAEIVITTITMVADILEEYVITMAQEKEVRQMCQTTPSVLVARKVHNHQPLAVRSAETMVVRLTTTHNQA